MQAIRPFLRRSLLSTNRFYLRSQLRAVELSRQHRWATNNYGPHKEYFQTPGQAPLPDSTPYDPNQPIQTVPQETGPSRIAGAFRGLLWGALFGTLGIAAGVTFVTWDYLQPPFAPGSPEEQELLEEIDDLLNTHPVVLGLRELGYTEEDFQMRRALADREKGQNLVHETLQGSSQTLRVKAFKDPNQNYTFLVFFVGFGLDGWPDVMHGGVTASMMLEAMEKHLANYPTDAVLDNDKSSIKIDYKTPVRPGEIYTIMVPPRALEPDPNDHSKTVFNMAALLLRLELVPELSSQWDASTNSLVHKVDVHYSGGQSPYMAAAHMTIPVIKRTPKPLAFSEPPSFALAKDKSVPTSSEQQP